MIDLTGRPAAIPRGTPSSALTITSSRIAHGIWTRVAPPAKSSSWRRAGSQSTMRQCGIRSYGMDRGWRYRSYE